MGTAVLLPQDCLPASKSRHKSNFTDVLYQSSSSPRAGGGTPHALDYRSFYVNPSRQRFNSNKRADWSAAPGSIPFPEHGQALTKTISFQRELDGKNTKTRRPMEARDVAKFASKPGPDVRAVTILQRPKDKVLANELIAKILVKTDESKAPVGLSDLKSDVKVNDGKLGSGAQNARLDARNGVKKKMAVPVVERPKFQCPKLDVPKLQGSIPSTSADSSTTKDLKEERDKVQASSKPVYVTNRSVNNRFDDLLSVKGLNQMLSLKVRGDHKSIQTAGAAENFSRKLVQANRPARVNIMEGDVTRLERASTDPQIVKHLVGCYRSEVLEIPRTGAKSLHGITRSSSMSCPERWAGPAYSSSPAPSSLPLPKFTRVNQKLSSSDPSSPSAEVEGCNTKLAQLFESGSVCALPGVPQGGELDVASATRSLRRMLKLEPL